MDDAFAVARCQVSEAKTAMVILRTVTIMNNFINNMKVNFAKIKELKQQQHGHAHFKKEKANLEIPLDAIQLLTNDSLEYFNPEKGETDEENQIIERLQRNRQDLFQAEGLVALLLKVDFDVKIAQPVVNFDQRCRSGRNDLTDHFNAQPHVSVLF